MAVRGSVHASVESWASIASAANQDVMPNKIMVGL
jgi:hypothetical protein